MSDGKLSRRELLKKAGVGAAALGVSGASAPFSFAGPHRFTGRWLKGDLSIIQWVHFVPAYDDWFDKTWVTQWGQKNDVQVNVEHINNTLLDTRAAAEVAAQSGHDLFFSLHPLASYEDQVINHAPIIHEIEKKVGKYGDLAKASTYNPKTKKYFAVSDSYVPDPVIWRHDLWNGIGEAPFTWDHVRKAAPKLKALGHPIGIGQSQELDSNMALIAFMMCFGAFVQNEHNRPTLNTKHAVEAVKFMSDLYSNGEDSAIFGWNPASNNNYLYSGTASLILNAISATRTPEAQNLPFSKDRWIWPIPIGPHGRLSVQTDPEGGGRGHPSAAREVHDSHDDRREVHAQHRLPGHDERRDGRGVLEVPHPADVRAGVAGQAERGGLGELDGLAGKRHLQEVGGPREDLTRLTRRAPGDGARRQATAASTVTSTAL